MISSKSTAAGSDNYESERMKVLIDTHLLDSDPNESNYDRFTSLARRIFDVPIALVSLVDTDRQWFKSKDGLEAAQTARDISFCTHTVMEDGPEVFVVLDANKDERFKNNPLVKGPPYVIFYAGAALIVDNVRIGSLCIIDNKPHNEFCMKDRMSLLDLGFAVATLIKQQSEARKRLESEKSKLMISIMHNMRTPMTSLTLVRSLLDNKSGEMMEILKKLPQRESAQFYEVLEELDNSVRQLNVIVETSLSLGNSMVEISKFSKDDPTNYASIIAGRGILFKLSSVIDRLQ
jgi:hypothetical protein